MKNLLIISVILLIFSTITISQNVTVSGYTPSRTGEEIVFYTYSDYITNTEVELCHAIVDMSGKFNCEFLTDRILYCYCYLGIYKGSLFVEPGKSYELVLPGKNEKKPEDIVNPYFEEMDILLGIENINDQELNFNIRLFDEYYYELLRSDMILKRENKNRLDTVISELDSAFSMYSHPFFDIYKEYKLSFLRYLSYQRNFRFAAKEYFLDRTICFDNPGYMEFFNNLFEKFFSFYSQTVEGHRILEDIARSKSPVALKETIGNNMAVDNDTLKEFIILKALHDAFYFDIVGVNDHLPRRQLFQTLDSMRLTAIVPEYRQIAENIHEKVIKLNKGTRAPDFDLYDIDSNLVGLKDFRGKFLYIGFYTTLSFSCKEDIEPLKALRKKHGHAYSIVSVFIDDDFRAAVDFMRDNGCKWTLLHYGNRPEILKQYDVRAYPTYYLIDPDGNLSMSPAPGPDEDFETRFYEVIKTWRK